MKNRMPSSHCNIDSRCRFRRGFSLLEILLALAILGGSLAILSRIVETGTSAAIEARSLAEARLVCQAKLTEILLDAANGQTPQSVFSVPIDSFDESFTSSLNYSVEVLPPPIENIVAIRVTVVVQSPSAQSTLASYALTRWIVDPMYDLQQMEIDEQSLRQEMEGAQEAETGGENANDENSPPREESR